MDRELGVLANIGKTDDPRQLKEHVRLLKTMVISMAQDLAALRHAMTEKGLLADADYKRHRMDQILGDHNTQGPRPWEGYSWYRYLLPEDAFLEKVLGASPEEVAIFRRDQMKGMSR